MGKELIAVGWGWISFGITFLFIKTVVGFLYQKPAIGGRRHLSGFKVEHVASCYFAGGNRNDTCQSAG